MSQRIAGCCCGKCVNAALGVCCIKLPASTANCLGDCEGFDPQTLLSVGTINNLTTAQCTQAGIDYGLNTVFTVYPNCAPITICDCIESVTECVCANQNGIWNGSNNCATGCLGSCCVLDLNGQRISCHDLMTECNCDALKSPTQNTVWTVGLNCINSPCKEKVGCTLWLSEFTRISSEINYGDTIHSEAEWCRCVIGSSIVYTSYDYLYTKEYLTGDPTFDRTQYNKITKSDTVPFPNCLTEVHYYEETKYTKIRDICDEAQNSCNIDRHRYTTTIKDYVCYQTQCRGCSSDVHTNNTVVSNRQGDNITICCDRLYSC